MKPYKLIFLGSPAFSIPTLEGLHTDKRFEIIAVFTQPDKKVGRKQVLTPSSIKQKAIELDLPVFSPTKINTLENIELIKKLEPDFLFTIAYGQIISQSILKIPKIEAINLHSSLLPKYRGASPIQSSLLNGDKETGITYIRMIDKMDAGEMFWKEIIKIEKEDNAETVSYKISQLGKKITPDILVKIAKRELKEEIQNEKEVSYCKKITKSDGLIDWENETAEEVLNKIRAYTPWPGCFTYFQGKMLKIKVVSCQLSVVGETSPLLGEIERGKVIQTNNQILITTKSGFILPEIVQLEGKKAINVQEFIKGKPEFVGTTLSTSKLSHSPSSD